MSFDLHDAKIGKLIRVHRIAKRMSQEELGKHLGVTFQQVQKYEKGANKVSAARLLRIATVMKVPVVTFYGTVKGATMGNSPLELLSRSDAFKLAEAFDRISSRRVRKSVVALVQKLAEFE